MPWVQEADLDEWKEDSDHKRNLLDASAGTISDMEEEIAGLQNKVNELTRDLEASKRISQRLRDQLKKEAESCM